jgi:peptidoglycan/LPS O-acetylase OafA/YrhL
MGGTQTLRITAAGIIKLFPFTRSVEIDFEPLPIAWALRVEFMFYFVCCGVLAIQHIVPATLWYPRVASFGVAALMGTGFLVDAVSREEPTMFRFIPYFLFGASSYFAEQSTSNRRDALVVGLLAILAIALEQAQRPPFHETAGFARDKTAEFAILSVMIGMLVCLSICHVRGRMLTVDRFLGDLSYPLYIGHFSVLLIWSAVFQPSWRGFASAWSCAAFVSLMLQRLVEEPIRRLRTVVRGQTLR